MTTRILDSYRTYGGINAASAHNFPNRQKVNDALQRN